MLAIGLHFFLQPNLLLATDPNHLLLDLLNKDLNNLLLQKLLQVLLCLILCLATLKGFTPTDEGFCHKILDQVLVKKPNVKWEDIIGMVSMYLLKD
jgi:hypothetical protein